MGGEPTFVANTDRGAAEWNIDALGPTKRDYGIKMLNKLAKYYGKGGFYHFGQGKWYPGEQLPRWALSMYWLKSGEPIWKNSKLLSHEQAGGKATNATAKQFLESLCSRLGLHPRYVMPGYEDAWYYMWRERKLPVNVDPFDSRLDDPLERKRLNKVFTQGLTEEVGYCLPIQSAKGQWRTGQWFLRDERMYLIPGDSAMGYRLPLDSQPWVAKKDFPYTIPADPFAPPAPSRVAPSKTGRENQPGR
jgi:uncharacterized protein (DUF2126 family)